MVLNVICYFFGTRCRMKDEVDRTTLSSDYLHLKIEILRMADFMTLLTQHIYAVLLLTMHVVTHYLQGLLRYSAYGNIVLIPTRPAGEEAFRKRGQTEWQIERQNHIHAD